MRNPAITCRMPHVTIVFPARNEGRLLAATLASLAATPADADFAVVVVDDGSQPAAGVDGGFGLPLRLLRTAGEGAAAARNRGAAISRAPLLCFCDAHLEFTPGWLGTLLRAVDGFDAVSPAIAAVGRPEAVGYGFTWTESFAVQWLPRPEQPREVPMLPGGCILVPRDVFWKVGGFDAGLVPWGYEDAEFSWALWLTGRRCGVQPRCTVRHHFRARHPYPVAGLQVQRNLLRLGCVHFGPERLARTVRHVGADAATLNAVRAQAASRSRLLEPGRVHDDEWLCRRFGIPV